MACCSRLPPGPRRAGPDRCPCNNRELAVIGSTRTKPARETLINQTFPGVASRKTGFHRGVAILLLQDRRKLRQYFVDDHGRYAFQLPGMSGAEVEGSRLVTADHPCRSGTGAGERYRETGRACKTSTAADGQHDRRLRKSVERSRRDHANGPHPALFVTRSRVERDEVNIATFHHSSSRPVGFASSHDRSSAVRLTLGWHRASSSSSV